MSELLLIDDDQELCELLSSWLSQEGFHVRACHDGQSARKALAETAPAAVVLEKLAAQGIKALPTDSHRIRFVLHLDVHPEQVEYVVKIISEL